MSTETVTINFGSDTVTMSWDGAQASASILVDGEPTGYQTADARHRTADAVRLVAGRVWPEESFADGSEAWDALSYETEQSSRIVWGVGNCLCLDNADEASPEDIKKAWPHLLKAGLAADDKGILGDAWVCVSDLSEGELDLLREVRGHMERA